MSNLPFPAPHLSLFKCLFRGREDVFAVRWEKGSKSGYMPAYTFDPYQYKVHKMNGGSFQNFPGKHYQSLSDAQLLRHLNGEQLVGLYPLLKDNTSWFIAADFDKENWADDCRKFLRICEDHGIPAYLERSRSGKGGHVWVFFEKPYPAFRSRKIFTALLEKSDIFSIFEKDSSFDRLFPNQDFLSGKGLGNLIALPLYKLTWEKGNSCFIDPENLSPIIDQWEFLQNIKRIPLEKLDLLFQELSQKGSSQIRNNTISPSCKTIIRLDNSISIDRSGLTTALINFLRDELNFANSEYFIKKKIGKNTWGTDRYFKMIDETENEIIIPRGFAGKLIHFCREQKIDYDFKDERIKLNPVQFSASIQLREYQKPAFDAASKKDFGVIVAPPGSGKTIIGLSIIAAKKQPALIVVHRKQLADQWIDRIESFLGIPKREIGKIGQGQIKIGKHITVAMIQSLDKAIQSEEGKKLEKAFGTIIVDECHHVPAETFRNTISKLHSFYIYGLTATPFRKYNDGKLIFIYLGETIAEIKTQELETTPGAKIVIRNTDLSVPFNAKTDKFETLSKILVHDSTRNKLILDDVVAELNKGKKAVIVTERKEHIDTLFQYLKQKYEAITLSGEDSESDKKFKWKQLSVGNFQVLITTGQYFGEGTDLQNVECLFLVYPFSFEGKLIQYIGRVQRSEIQPAIYDYRDSKIEYLENLFQERNVFYRKLYGHGTLFNQPEQTETHALNSYVIEKRIGLSITEFEFKFGAIAFKVMIPELGKLLYFEVENSEIRPEFEVLKSYFSKILRIKKIKVDIQVRVDRGEVIFQSATSFDLNKINREIIDSVKFQFVSKKILGKFPDNAKNILDLNQVQDNGNNIPPLYNSEQDLLDEILKNKNARHYRHLVYLSQKHENKILKLRFVVSPFSFVFLLSGKQQYHIVWETLDTEEATYIWHTEKNISALKLILKQIETDIGIIRTQGRQHYIELQTDNFSRIVHDYSDERKGFVVWKDLVEEKMR